MGPTARFGARDRIAATTAVLLAAFLRLPGLLLGVEHYGDAPVRVELAQRWLLHPHFFRGFSETYQYGPLHLAMLGFALELSPNRLVSPRLLSFAFALAGVWLLYALSRRVTSTAGAFAAAAALAFDTVHMQSGSSAASEAIFLAMLLGTIELITRAFEAEGAARLTAALIVAGLLLGAAGLVRYDGWIYAALICAMLVFGAFPKAQGPTPKAQSRARALLAFAVPCALPALWWMWRNQLDVGDALMPLRHVDIDHRALADQGLRWFGPIGYRLYCLFYWPVNVLVLSSPLFGLFSLVGAGRALIKRSAGWQLAALAWIPAAYFTFRGSIRADFRPMSRFVLPAAAMSLPFAWNELARLSQFLARKLGPLANREAALQRAFAGVALALAIGTPLFFFTLSYGKNGNTAEWARPLSPVSSVPPGIEQAARYLREHATPDDQVILDGVWDYLEIPLAFESNLPETQFTRLAYDNFEAKLTKVTPTMAVLLYQGNLQYLAGTKDAKWQSPEFDFRGIRFCREAEFVYAGVYRVCPAKP